MTNDKPVYIYHCFIKMYIGLWLVNWIVLSFLLGTISCFPTDCSKAFTQSYLFNSVFFSLIFIYNPFTTLPHPFPWPCRNEPISEDHICNLNNDKNIHYLPKSIVGFMVERDERREKSISKLFILPIRKGINLTSIMMLY